MGWSPRNGFRRVPAAAMLTALLCCAGSRAATQFQGALPYSVTLSHIQQVGGVSTGSTPVPLAHDTPCWLTVSGPQVGFEILTLGGGGSGGPTLTTAYMITGIADSDADWLDAATFRARSYSLPGNNITDTLTLSVKASAPAGAAPEPGNYTATIILTVTF